MRTGHSDVIKANILSFAFQIRRATKMRPPFLFCLLNDKSGVDDVIVEKQPYKLLNTSPEFFSSFHGSSFHKFDD